MKKSLNLLVIGTSAVPRTFSLDLADRGRSRLFHAANLDLKVREVIEGVEKPHSATAAVMRGRLTVALLF
jgi:hypothetical protein